MIGPLDVLGWILMVGGLFFLLTGALGIIRMPDVFTRMHAAGMTDTMGAGLMLLGLATQTGEGAVVLRLLLILVLLWLTSPVATHALAKAALHGHVDPELRPGGRGGEGGAS